MKRNTEIPKGCYCYDENGLCPHWEKRHDKPEQENGYCHYLQKGDWDFTFGLLWDQCKECGVNLDEENEDEMEPLSP